MSRYLSRWSPPLVWTGVIFLLSTDNFSNESTGSILRPLIKLLLGPFYSEELGEIIHFCVRKASHVTEYAILAVLWYRAVNAGLRGWGVEAAVTAVLLSAGYAALDEFHQTLTASRGGNPVDVLVDSTGALIGIGIVWSCNLLLDRTGRRWKD